MKVLTMSLNFKSSDRQEDKTTLDCVTSGDLYGGHVPLQPDDLPDQLAVAHPDQLVHGRPWHVLGSHDRPGHGEHVPKL